MKNIDMPSIIFRLQNELYSISSEPVIAIIKMPKVTSIPMSDNNTEGMIRYRDKVFKLFNLREILNKNSLESEKQAFVDMVDARANDHINWVKELKKSLSENRPFKLTTDPHACAFGKWYDRYTTDNIFLKDILQEFDEPHKRIHAVGIKIEELKQQNKLKEANMLIAQTEEKELKMMLKLFKDLKDAFIRSNRELVLILSCRNKRCAIQVDEVLSVEHLNEITTSSTDYDIIKIDRELFEGLANSDDNEMVVKLSSDYFLTGAK